MDGTQAKKLRQTCLTDLKGNVHPCNRKECSETNVTIFENYTKQVTWENFSPIGPSDIEKWAQNNQSIYGMNYELHSAFQRSSTTSGDFVSKFHDISLTTGCLCEHFHELFTNIKITTTNKLDENSPILFWVITKGVQRIRSISPRVRSVIQAYKYKGHFVGFPA